MSLPNNTNSLIPACDQQIQQSLAVGSNSIAIKRGASETTEDPSLKKNRSEKSLSRITSFSPQCNSKQKRVETWCGGVNREEGLKLIKMKDTSTSSGTEDLIVIRNFGSAEFSNMVQSTSPLHSEELSDEYVLFASDVIDYIDNDNYLETPSKSASPELKELTEEALEISCSKILNKTELPEHVEVEDIPQESSGMNEIEFVLLPSHKEIVNNKSNKPDSIIKDSGTVTSRLAPISTVNIPSTVSFNRNSASSSVPSNVLNNVASLPSPLKGQQFVVAGAKKVMSEVKQTTAKVSIGNTTISVPLLKPLSSSQVVQPGNVFADSSKAQQTSTAQSTSLQQAQFSLSKILNVKRNCPKLNQPTIVSLSQLQIKPVSTAKIVQAKVVGKKMQLQLPSVLPTSNIVSSSSSTSVVTITASKSKTASVQNIPYLKSPTKKDLVGSKSDNCVILSTSEKIMQEASNAISDKDKPLNTIKLVKSVSKDIAASNVTVKQNELSSSVSSQISIVDSECNQNTKTAVRKIFSSANTSNNPPTLMPLCKLPEQSKQIQVLSNVSNNKKSYIASSVKIIKQAQGTQSIACSSSGCISSVSESKTVTDASHTYETITTRSQPLAQAVSGCLNKVSGSSLITMPRNISVLLTKGKSNQHISTSVGNVNNAGHNTNANTDQLTKKLNLCRTNSLNITALNLPQSSSHNVEANAITKVTEIATSKAPIISAVVQPSDLNATSSDNKVNVGNLAKKVIKIPASSVSFLTTPNAKRMKTNESDIDKDEYSNFSFSHAKKCNTDTNTENLRSEQGVEKLQNNSKNALREGEDTNVGLKILVSSSQPNNTLISCRQEETHNVLLKQLLQNASSSVSVATTATKSPSPPVCSQVLSARKVINVRAPSLGLVSSLEAQLARPVLPPVPTTTHQERQMDILLQKSSIHNNSVVEKECTVQNDLKSKSVVQIISKETSFVSSPNIANKCLQDQLLSEKQNTSKTSSTTSIPLSESTTVLYQKESVENSNSDAATNKTSPKEEMKPSQSKTSENMGSIMLNISSTSTIKTITPTDTGTKLLTHQPTVPKTKAITEELCTIEEYKNSRNNSSNKEETVLVAKFDNDKTFQESQGNFLVLKTDENMEGLRKNIEVSNVIKSTSNQNISTDTFVCDTLQKQPLLNKSQDNVNKSTPIKDNIKDVEFRKKRKRDYQKHRRQFLNSNKELLRNHSVASITSTSSYSNKKRPRKILKVEEDYDNFIENLMSHIRQMQPLQVLEPVLGSNYNACSMHGRNFTNLKESAGKIREKLFGDFGNAKHSQIKSCYDEVSLGGMTDDEDKNMFTIQNDFYDQEFLPVTCSSKSEKMFRFIGMIRERLTETSDIIQNKNKICSDGLIDSQRSGKYNILTFLSYPGLILKNNSGSQCFGRMSPILPYVDPTLQSSIKLPLRSLKEDESQICIDQKPPVDPLITNGEKLSKCAQSETVILSLSMSAVSNIMDILKDLANLLNMTLPSEYKVLDPVNTDNKFKWSIPTKRKLLNDSQKSYMQEIINGRRKVCGNCAKPIIAGGVRSIRKTLDTGNNLGNELPIFESYIHFCSRICYMHKKLQCSNSALHSTTKLERNSMDDTFMSTKKSSTNCSDKKPKKNQFKYFAENCFTPTPSLRNASEKEILDILFKLDITVSAFNDSHQPIEDTRQCIFCNQRGDSQSDGPSRLLNFDIDKYVHLNCALWSNGVYETISGGLMNLHAAIQMGLSQTCIACQNFGATVKCIKNRCFATYHLPCALKEGCVFYKNKTVLCQQHASKLDKENELSSLAVYRRVFVERDENRQVAAVMHQAELSNLLRIGSLTFLSIGQLLPHQLEAFHNNNFIYPIGYKIIRFYWSMKRPNKRCRYICSIVDAAGKPEFRIEVQEPYEEKMELQESTPKSVWLKVLEPIAILRNDKKLVQLFTKYISGEDLFGLTEPAIVRIIESLPGVENLTDYRFKYGRNPLLELPLAINPSGSARTEPKQRQILGWRKPHTQRTATVSNQRVANIVSPVVAGEVTCPYSKQFVHSKSSQYKKMKQEWRNNVYLARSKIQGLGLYAARDMEKHTMIIEYIGEVIRTEVSEIREKQYESRNRGIYMFRLDEERVVDATLSGGLARYINHSCNPNCVTEIVEVDRELRIIIFAKRRISRGEELSYDYKFDIEDDANKIQCMCGAPNCRKWMN